ncbi:SCO family protein [Putridiphycobacter roseus]|uniref:SCO family protein n=1 Tax=Putridiphycobacter roseus TaxID=2219161 RepID=A0A2W1NQS5_9FLAO|nr:SCO family protein [Putridiphycobacter roseus]PZE18002.1 SCO family protein [Putridiphycobacter roseus]
MKRILLNSVLVLLLFACSNKAAKKVVVLAELPFYEDASFTPVWMSLEDPKLKEFHAIKSFTFTNQNGEIINEKTFEGKVYVTDFFYTTCPGICPKMTTNMKVVQDAFLTEEDVLLLSHSVTPEKDSIAQLKEYAQNKGVVDGRWHLVTGDRKTIYDLGRNTYFIEEDLGLEKTEDEFLHTENFVLIDQNKHIRGIYNGLNKASIAQLISDVNILLEEGK